YVQSFIGNTLKEVKDLLDKGKSVLFCGCPCQVAGLYAFLQKDYENLFTMDLLCLYAPSPLHFKKYIDETFGKNRVLSYTFRSKINGWGHSAIIETKDGRTFKKNIHNDTFQILFHSRRLKNKACERCLFSVFPRQADITVGDFWGISNRDSSLDDKKGTSVLLINNEKGEKLLKMAQEKAVLCKETPLQWLGGNGTANNAHSQRKKFFSLFKTKSFLRAALYALLDIPESVDIDKKSTLFRYYIRYYRYKVFSKILFGKKKQYYIEKRDKYHQYVRAFRSLKRGNNIEKATID
ncbi:MAG: Coenzyme F420 hydrogenase/dehydrogenase, beta subunit C-terminal domain, partial [Elusimicrobiota bacterium]|nr:Coenzyme F420 hydrogenase/dehydrogenase, beta subunit C-terminal domain [Elusimicrobiota bacterium]